MVALGLIDIEKESFRVRECYVFLAAELHEVWQKTLRYLGLLKRRLLLLLKSGHCLTQGDLLLLASVVFSIYSVLEFRIIEPIPEPLR